MHESANTPTNTQIERSPSSWFRNMNLSNISSSIIEATSKVGTAATSFVQKTVQQVSSTEALNTDTVPVNNRLTDIVNGLSTTIFTNAQQLKQIIEEKSFIRDFTKEQGKFVQEKLTQKVQEKSALPPWIGCNNENEIKQQILALSQEVRNFISDPPLGNNDQFDMTSVYPIALTLLEIDENLRNMRFDLVPKQINEETFWRNYFYRVNLIKQSDKSTSIIVNDVHRKSESDEKQIPINQEFVSDEYDMSDVNMDEIRREIEQFSKMNSNSNEVNNCSPDIDESEWDKTLSDDLENISAEELEAHINQMLTGNVQ